MKALVCREFGPVETLEISEMPEPPLAAGSVRVKVRSAGINFPDGLVVQGKYQLKPALPFSPGSEFSGTVIEAADGVQGFAPGDRVFGLTSFGAFAEQLVVPAERLNHMHSSVSFETAAVLSMAYGAAMYALMERGRLVAGERVMILGATGGVGLAAVELAANAGAHVLAVDGDDLRLKEAEAKGAKAVFNYETGELREAAKDFAGTDGFDLILDPVGGALGETAVRCLAWKGRLLVFGFASGDIPRIATNLLLLKGAEAIGVFWGESQRRNDNRDIENFRLLQDWLVAGKLSPHIGGHFPLEDGATAIQALMDRKIAGKAVIEVASG